GELRHHGRRGNGIFDIDWCRLVASESSRGFNNEPEKRYANLQNVSIAYRLRSCNLIAVQECAVTALIVLNAELALFIRNHEVEAGNRLVAADNYVVEVVAADFAGGNCNRNFAVGY